VRDSRIAGSCPSALICRAQRELDCWSLAVSRLRGPYLTERRARAWASGRTDVHAYLVEEQPASQISQICAQLNRLDSGTESVGASGQGEAGGVWVMNAAAATAGRPGAAGGP
jgi:hypothetical protein